ncbi:MAG: hypothetical protein LKH07_06555, partial [Acetobacter peroxydans]|nr:hypothetical protein [Acetobacter peroxydans]
MRQAHVCVHAHDRGDHARGDRGQIRGHGSRDHDLPPYGRAHLIPYHDHAPLQRVLRGHAGVCQKGRSVQRQAT